jgi:Flp pilus assembly protein TadG
MSALRFGRARRGDVVLEFAVVIPLLLALILGIIDFGWLVWTGEAVQEGAAAGARCMGVLGSSCTNAGAYSSSATLAFIQGVIAARGITLPANSATLNTSTTCGSTSGFSKVSISFTYTTIVPNVLNAFGVRPVVSVVSCFPNQPS